MISSNDFRTGTSIELDGQVWRVVEFLHVKPGKGSAFVRTKLKAVQSGNVVEKTFRAGETVPQAVLEKSTLQHTYMEADDYVFMDMGTFEETRLTLLKLIWMSAMGQSGISSLSRWDRKRAVSVSTSVFVNDSNFIPDKTAPK